MVTFITQEKLMSSEKWLINAFLSDSLETQKIQFPLVKLREVVSQRKDGIDPQKYADWDFCYIGLENVESHTGFLMNFDVKRGEEIKSRSKIFQSGDILFGKLRPNLNKVYLVPDDFNGGICSNEFFVLMINQNKIRSNFLKFLLGSEFVLNQIKSFTAGTALPRIHIEDFLNITIPLPPLDYIELLDKDIKYAMNKLQAYRNILLQFPSFINSRFEENFVNGNEIDFDFDKCNSVQLEPKGGLPL